jgi:cardiolipin synthase (CMP-forming)
MNIPNLITLGRFALVPIVIALILDRHWQAAFWCFVLAGVSDAIDGFIARRFGMHTELGAYLDPLADKALLVTLTITLAIEQALPFLLVIMIVFRDIMIVGAVMLAWIVDHPLHIKPLLISKANTCAQITLVAFTLGANAYAISSPVVMQTLIATTALLTFGSMLAYAYSWMNHMAGSSGTGQNE